MLKTILQNVIIVLAYIITLEVILFFAGFPPGASNFTEAIVIRNQLNTKKSNDEIRIFAFGESTMKGAHYSPVSDPALWLDTYLKHYLPDENIRVVNFARMGRGIDYTLRVFKEALAFQPDIAIFYNGHNDYFPKERKDEIASESNPVKYLGRKILLKSRFVSWLNRILIKIRMKRDKLQEDRMGHMIIETNPRSMIPSMRTPRNEDFYWKNLDYFRDRVTQILELGNIHDVELVFFLPVSNIKDFEPVESRHLKNISEEQLLVWNQAYQKGMRLEAKNKLDPALEAYQIAYEIDDTYANLAFRMGKIYFKKKEYDKSRDSFERSRDYDVVIVRATKDLHAVYRSLEKEKGLVLIDTEALLESVIEGGVLGEPLFEDNVHLSIEGHSYLGKKAAEVIAEKQWIAPYELWRWDQEPHFEEVEDYLGIDKELRTSSYIKVADYYSNRFKPRLRYAEKAYRLSPENTQAIRELAWTYWLMGKKEISLKLYKQLQRINSEALQDVFALQHDIEDFIKNTNS